MWDGVQQWTAVTGSQIPSEPESPRRDGWLRETLVTFNSLQVSQTSAQGKSVFISKQKGSILTLLSLGRCLESKWSWEWERILKRNWHQLEDELIFSRQLCLSSECLILVPEMGNLNWDCGSCNENLSWDCGSFSPWNGNLNWDCGSLSLWNGNLNWDCLRVLKWGFKLGLGLRVL